MISKMAQEVFDGLDADKEPDQNGTIFPSEQSSNLLKMIDQWENSCYLIREEFLSLLCKIYSWLELKTLVQLWMSQIKFDEDPEISVSSH